MIKIIKGGIEMDKWLKGIERVNVNENGNLMVDSWFSIDDNYVNYIYAIGEEELKRVLKSLVMQEELQSMYDYYNNDVIEELQRASKEVNEFGHWYENITYQLALSQMEKYAEDILSGTREEFEQCYGDRFNDVIDRTYRWIKTEVIKLYNDIWQKESVRYAEAIDTANELLDVDYDSIAYIKCFDDIESAIEDIEKNFGAIGEAVLDYFFENDIYLHNLKGGKVLVVKYND